MIKKCKWCKKEQEMSGKREFCPGEKCKNAWKYANRTGKLDNINNQKVVKCEKQVKSSDYPTIVGQLTRVTTTADQCVRIQIDTPVDGVKFNMIEYLNQNVVVAFIEEGNNEKKENTETNKKERFFKGR